MIFLIILNLIYLYKIIPEDIYIYKIKVLNLGKFQNDLIISKIDNNHINEEIEIIDNGEQEDLIKIKDLDIDIKNVRNMNNKDYFDDYLEFFTLKNKILKGKVYLKYFLII